jgi:hypothetical protein
MAAAQTFEVVRTYTVPSDTTTFTLSSISQSYTHLYCVTNIYNNEVTSELFDITNDISETEHDDLADCVTDAFYYTYIDRGLWDAEILPYINNLNESRSLLDILKEELKALN